MKISIAMATYNGARYLQAQLDSFTRQTRRPDELVITDDCSSDETVEIVKDYAKHAPFEVRWGVNDTRLGYAGNFNEALLRAIGDLVFLSDQDDVWFDEKLATMEAAANEKTDALILINDAVLTDADLHPTRFTKLGQTRAGGYSDHAFMMGCCAAIRRELLDLCSPIPTECESHDAWITKIAEGLGKREILEIPLQYYRRHGRNESDFVVNRIAKVSAKTVFLDRLTAAFSGRQKRQLATSAKETAILLERVAQMCESRPDWLPEEMRSFRTRLERELDIRKSRVALRDKPRYARIKPALEMLRRGDYAEFHNVTGALGDILGK